MNYQVVAPQIVTPRATLQLRTKVGPFYAGSILVVDPAYGRNLVQSVPECVSLSTPIVPGAYVIVYPATGCYGPPYYNPYGNSPIGQGAQPY